MIWLRNIFKSCFLNAFWAAQTINTLNYLKSSFFRYAVYVIKNNSIWNKLLLMQKADWMIIFMQCSYKLIRQDRENYLYLNFYFTSVFIQWPVQGQGWKKFFFSRGAIYLFYLNSKIEIKFSVYFCLLFECSNFFKKKQYRMKENIIHLCVCVCVWESS
jgi:hypothetical protein